MFYCATLSNNVHDANATLSKAYNIPLYKGQNEAFRVYVDATGYEREQMRMLKEMTILSDEVGDSLFIEELIKYNKIDYQSHAIINISVYPDTGRIARIRFARSSGVSEIDKLIGDDLTRWKIRLLNQTEGKNKPLNSFMIVYFITLENVLSKKETIDILKKYSN